MVVYVRTYMPLSLTQSQQVGSPLELLAQNTLPKIRPIYLSASPSSLLLMYSHTQSLDASRDPFIIPPPRIYRCITNSTSRASEIVEPARLSVGSDGPLVDWYCARLGRHILGNSEPPLIVIKRKKKTAYTVKRANEAQGEGGRKEVGVISDVNTRTKVCVHYFTYLYN